MLKIVLLFSLLFFSSCAFSKTNDVSLELNHVDIRSALQLLTEMEHLNLVLTDEVQGSITLYLKNVRWREALDLVLKTKGLTQRRIGNTLWVAKTTEIMSQDKQRWQAQQQADELEPFIMRSIPIHYAKASDVLTILNEKNSGILSEHGHILADDRSQLIWLNDTPSHVNATHNLIRHLDVPLQQVMIEARIVNIDRSFEKNLGVHFSASRPVTGRDEEDNIETSPSNTTMSFGSSGLAAANPIPAGMLIAKLGHGMLLDVQLAALENEGKGEYISHPKLITQNQKTAIIQAGEEIPFQERTRSGATSVSFKKAVLSLEVTPRILPNKQMLLDLKVSQDSPGVRLNNDMPMIDTRQIETHVQVKNGQTLVLGGILEENKRRQRDRIPFLSDIPIIGHLFECHDKAGEQRELLVFITPTILRE
jgi:type IV pilus assembly protein PilQ